MAERRPLIAGNWKMNGLIASADVFDAIVHGVAERADYADALICPPATLLFGFGERSRETSVVVGAQDCHPAESGAHTGDLSAEMIAETGAQAVIVGHSERRADHGETDAMVRAKAEAARRAGLVAIICIGETLEERDAGRAVAVATTQLAGSTPDAATPETVVIAYEPVWAIGTGRTATPTDIAEIHGALREALRERFGAEGEAFRILYGGSVKPGNAAEIFAVPNVDGALIGGASLKAEDFLAIYDAAG
ncbi:MAG: triose-phosphate isomerase [Pseudomonadota bacterium]